MIRPSTLLCTAAVVAVGYAMFQVKDEVMQQEKTLAGINQQIANSRDSIRVLEAEWSFLTQPARLDSLTARYLSLVPVTAARIGQIASLPNRPGTTGPLVSAPEAVPPEAADDARVATITLSPNP